MQETAVIEQYLYENIPLSKEMGVQIKQLSEEEAHLFAPLAPNVNHKLTAFGGSLHAVATLSCWCLLYKKLYPIIDEIDIVLRRSEVDFLSPVSQDFTAISSAPLNATWEKFYAVFSKKKKAKIQLSASVVQNGQAVVQYTGSFGVIAIPS